MDEPHGDTPDQYVHAGQSTRRKSWTQDMPALRLGRRVAFRRTQRQEAVDSGIAGSDTAGATLTLNTSPPRFLRLIRFVVGVMMLGLAWVGILTVVMLAQALIQPITRQHLITHLLFDIALVSATCLVGITVLGCLILGAFCLTLALINSDWQ